MKHLVQSPTDAAFVQNPYAFYDLARREGDVFFWTDYDMPMAVSHRAVDKLLRDRRFGRQVPVERAEDIPPHLAPFFRVEHNSMLELEPPAHSRVRALVARAFTSRQIQALAPDISQLADAAIDRFPDGPFDLIPALARDLPVIVIARLLGVPEGMAAQLLAWSNAMVGMYQARRTHEMETAAASAASEFTNYLADYIDHRRKQPSDDLLTRLIAVEASGEKLSSDELISTCILLLNAGHEATVHTIGNAVKTILETGMSLQALRPTFVEDTIEELLRFDPPLHLFTRYAYEDVELFGINLERGDKIGLLLAAANRDPAVFAEPNQFDPTRGDARHLSFGAGIHFCLGAPLARLELQIVLPLLFARCPGLKLEGTPHYANLFHFHGLSELSVSR